MLIVFAILDLISALTLGLLYFNISVKFLILTSAIYLIVKGIIFLKDIASIIDLIIAGFLLISLFITIPKIVLLVFAIFLLQKAIFSFIS
jgi:hypothetical protein